MGINNKNIIRLLLFVSIIAIAVNLQSQEPAGSDIEGVVSRYIKMYFPEPARTISTVTGLGNLGLDEVYLVDLEPEGWFIVSGDKRAEAVLAFSASGEYFTGSSLDDNPANRWIESYNNQVEFLKDIDNTQVSRSWDYSADLEDFSKADDPVTVEPLITVTWNQGSGWNMYCPEDAAGPGGHAYVGCVGVAMAQAISAYRYPLNGAGVHSYNEPDYGTLEVNYSEAEYRWEEMKADKPDTLNAKLLYHCAVGVNMNFGPDGSSAYSSSAPEAMRTHYLFSKFITYQRSSNFTELSWKNLIIDELAKGHPIIYRGEPASGTSAHAFNIDGVIESNMFHVNWGWGGSNNGYYLLTALSPGTRDYSYDHAAVIRIKPYYYPTDLVLSSNIVPEDEAEGAVIGNYVVVDEAVDNEYTIVLITDSTLVNGTWTDDYYIEGNLLKTGRTYPANEISKDTVWFSITDIYGNHIEIETELLFSGALGISPAADKSGDILVYPNPSSGEIYITATDDLPVERITVYSVDGRPLLFPENINTLSAIDLSPLPSGTYIIMVEWVNGDRGTKKVIKN